jgi:hypothetical protein
MLGRTVGMSAEDAVHIGTALLQYAGTVYGNRFAGYDRLPNCEPGDKEGKEI